MQRGIETYTRGEESVSLDVSTTEIDDRVELALLLDFVALTLTLAAFGCTTACSTSSGATSSTASSTTVVSVTATAAASGGLDAVVPSCLLLAVWEGQSSCSEDLGDENDSAKKMHDGQRWEVKGKKK